MVTTNKLTNTTNQVNFETNNFLQTFKNISASFQQIATSRSQDYTPSLIQGNNLNTFMQRKRMKTIDDMLIDDQVFGILELKKMILLSTGWHITIDDNEDKNNQTLKKFIEINFTKMYGKNFNSDLYNILTAQEYGFSISEKLYKRADYKDFKDKIWNYRLKTIPPHGVEFFSDNFGNLDKITQRQDADIKDLPLWKMLLYSRNERFDIPYGRSDLERCYKPYFLKDLTMKFWGIYLQRFAAPLVSVKVPDDYGEENTSALLNILNSIQQAMSVIIPESAQIEFVKHSTSSTSEYNTAIERFNQMIARALLVPDLVGFGQTTAAGSHALGQKHFEIFMKVLDYERSQLEYLINETVIKPLINMNFGDQADYPEFRFKPYDDSNKIEILKIFLDLTNKGLPITLEDYNYFRKLMNFPELEKDHEPINRQQSPTMPQNTDHNPDQPPNQSENPKDVSKPEQPENQKKNEMTMKFAKLRRQPDKYESRIDFIKEDEIIRSGADKVADSIAVILERSKNRLKSKILKDEIIKENKIRDVKNLTIRYFDEVKIVMKKGFRDIYDEGFNRAKDEIKMLKNQQDTKQEFQATINSVLVQSERAYKLAEQIIDEKTFQSIGTIKDDLLNQSKNVILSGMERGESEKEILKRLDILYNGYVSGAAASNLDINPNRLLTIVRTNFTTFYNQARMQVAKSSDLGDFIQMLEFSAIMDDRTTERCMSMDQFIADKNDAIWDSMRPPLHFSCRSVLRYITKIDVREDKLKPSPMPNVKKLREMAGGDFFTKENLNLEEVKNNDAI